MRQVRRGVGVRAVIIAAVLVAVGVTRPHETAAQSPALRWDGLIEHLTVAASAPQPNGASRLSRHSVTRDGRYVVFDSDATNLGPLGEPSAIYRRDRMTGQTERLFGMTGSDAVISADGNHMAFVHCAGWFRPDASSICDIYVVDLRNWSIVIASSGVDGAYSDGPSNQPVLSGNGRFVLFQTTASNLLAGGGSTGQILLRDRDADQDGIFDESEPGAVTLEIVSASSTAAAANGPSESAEISDDGQFVAFRSRADNLVAGDTNAQWDVFLRDRVSGETRRINVGWDGQEATPTTDSPHITMSADGRFVAFASDDSYLVPQWTGMEDTNNALDVFVYDRLDQSMTRIDLGVDAMPGNGATYSPMLTEDGRYILMVTTSTNVGAPSSSGLPLVYVHDRVTLLSQRVNYKPNWIESNGAWERPVISRDGSLIVFTSRATDLAAGVMGEVDAIYAASHFDVSPPALTLSGHGGRVTAQVTAQAFTAWRAELKGNGWLDYDSQPWGTGAGTVSFLASGPNPGATPRTASADINGRVVTITQGPGLTVSIVSPASGPAAGGNEVTITGTGFLNGTVAFFDGVRATRTEYVNATTLRADAPAHATGIVYVNVISPDGRLALLPNAYQYLDTTPPQITPYVEGTVGNNGWYTSDVSISWLIYEGDSPNSTVPAPACAQTWLRTDTEGTTYTCTATSEGGTASQSVTIKRDTRRPSVSLASPQETLYRVNQVVNASFSCLDQTPGSRIAACVGTVPTGTPIPVSTPGMRDFTVAATDRAGWTGSGTRRYGVAYTACQPWPQGLVAWWPGDNDYRDAAGNHVGTMINPVVQGTAFFQGIQGQAISTNSSAARYLQIGNSPDFEFTGPFTLASWFYVLSAQNPVNVLAGREGEYMLAYGPDGRLRYALQTTDHQWGWVNTGVAVPTNVYTHVAMTYDGEAVKIYVNGSLAFTRAATGPVGDALPDLDDFRIGARQLPSDPSYFTGHLDNVMVLARSMPASEVEGLFLSGVAGLCPKPTTVRIVQNPPVKAYGESWIEVVAELTGPEGPIAGRALSFFYGTETIGGGQITDANGIARHLINVPATQNPGTYANVIHVKHAVTSDLQASEVHGDLVVSKLTPVITWNTPAPITHGTPLNLTEQLNAVVNASGSFTYTPGPGTVLPTGDHTLSVVFEPGDPTRYTSATATTTISVRRGTPTITAEGGTFVYDGAPHAATGSVTGAGGLTLGPLTFTYNGANTPPVDAGVYNVLAEFAGDSNYEPASKTTTLTITSALPSVSLAGGTFTYDGTPHAASVSVTGVGGASLEPVTVTYNGSPQAPITPGEYAVVADFAGSTNYQAVSRSTTLTILRATPTVTVTAGSSIYDGQPHAAAASAIGINGEDLGPLTLTYNGASQVPVNAGSYAVSAAYAGSGNYTPAAGTATLVIAKAPAVVTALGGTFTYDGQPHAASGTATGVGGTSLPLTFTYNGGSDAPVAAGTYTVVASFAGDENHEPASGSATLTIAKAAASVTVNGGTLAYDGHPHAATGTATGVGGAALPLTFTYNGGSDVPVAAGTYTVVATFAGDANHEPASGSATLIIERATVVLQWTRPAAITYGTPLGSAQLSASANVPGTFTYTPGAGIVLTAGAARPLTAVFTPADSNLTGGSVETTIDVLPAPLTIRGNDAVKPFGALVPVLTASASGFVNGESWTALNGALAVTTTALPQSPVGTYPVVPSGVSSSNYAITFAAGALTVVRGSVVVSVTSSPQPSGFEQPLVLSASVAAAAPAAGNPAGTVQFFDGSVLLGTAILNPAGTASLPTAGLDAGSHTIEARFQGDGSFGPGLATRSHTVLTAIETPSITITSSRNPSNVGQTVTLTANVSLGTGAVEFYDGATLLATAPITAGRATFQTNSLAASSHAITVRYPGSASVPASQSGVFVQAVGEPGWKDRVSSIVISTSPSSSAPGAPVTISATVSGTTGTPTGWILFMVNGEVVGSVEVAPITGSSSTASLSLPGLAGGRHKVSATYLGNANYKGSTAQVTHAVN